MIEMRWRILDRSEWARPPMGAIMIGLQPQCHMQVLQYRCLQPQFSDAGGWVSDSWGPWMDVGFGVPQPAKEPTNEQR